VPRAASLHLASLAAREKREKAAAQRATVHGMGGVNYYPVIFRAVSRLPSNTPKARREVYEQARKALAAHTDSKREHNALEWTIRAVEKSPREIPGARASTASLVLSIVFLKVLWISDPTSMSAYWVVRPWNKHLFPAKRGSHADCGSLGRLGRGRKL
jgi:hypothetical protein